MRKRKTILIIDDEPDILMLIRKRLEANRFRCLTAENPVDGLRMAARHRPNLILLDLMLPKMSGLGFLRIIKGNPRIAKIPVVVLTALGDKEVANEALDMGAVGYLTKVSDPEVLLTMVREYSGAGDQPEG